ncbi:TIGR01777 family oxidoreductase [Flexistipes sp.]|uniref:TIGR01777 family oxidoreductase n=1 Tax=Flexistipes sp. TaxID=3088135 RepID=UPI002E1EDCBA|nr:TIGR01777 family oxidoreductase [Flexistipes sp.]
MINTFKKELVVDYEVEKLFGYHERPGVLRRLTPPWVNAEVLREPDNLYAGSSAVIRLKKFGIKLNWEASHTEYDKNKFFKDAQIKGPFRFWQHSHYFKNISAGSSKLTDFVEYELPLSALLDIAAGRSVRKELGRMFCYRHSVIKNDLSVIEKYDVPEKKILISGSGGVIGRELTTLLKMMGHKVYKLIRKKSSRADEIVYEPYSGYISDSLEGFDIVIHLAGDPIGKGRWTDNKKKAIRESRINTTRFLVERIKQLETPPEVFFSASAIGYYGDKGETVVDEECEKGANFISDLCWDWEKEALKLKDTCRIVTGRFGVVLTLKGGALKEYYNFYRFGLGFKIGRGEQWVSWISLDDALYSVLECIFNKKIQGAVNIVSDLPVKQKDFAETLANFMKRPVILKLPPSFVCGLFGQKGKEILLEGCRVTPSKLKEQKFTFFYNDLSSALLHLMGGKHDA